MKQADTNINSSYSVSTINRLDQFSAVKENWGKIYDADPNAQLFLSWLWLYGWFEVTPFEWSVLCVRDAHSDECIAFLPLIENGKKVGGFSPIHRLTMGGQPFAVYSGFLCIPEVEQDAIPLLGNYIRKNISWDTFHMNWVRDPRLELFLSGFSSADYFTELKESLTSLFIKLPSDFDDYLLKYLGRNNRQTYRKKVRNIESSDEFKITVTTVNSTEKEINAMMDLWQSRWNKKQEGEWYKHMLHHYLKNDLLWLFVIWQGEKPVSALSCLLDPAKKTVNAYITSYDPDFSAVSPGIVVFMKAIEFSINNGYHFFDFAVGLDRYKLTFGPKRKKTYSVNIQNNSLRSRIVLSTAKWMKKRLKPKNNE